MANHCGNYITVSGPDEAMSKFVDSLIKQEGGSFQIVLNEEARIYEPPTAYKEPDSEYPNGFGFSSAWAPPVDALIELSEKFPELTFVNVYEEGGNFFYGKSIYVNGGESDEHLDDEIGYYYNTYEEMEGEMDELQKAIDSLETPDDILKMVVEERENFEEENADEDGEFDESWCVAYFEGVLTVLAAVDTLLVTPFEDYPLLIGKFKDEKFEEALNGCLESGKAYEGERILVKGFNLKEYFNYYKL
jgi:hypothetical protein